MATTSSPHPVSGAAAASFNTAIAGLGASSLITFEGLPLGAFTNLSVAPGVTINGTDYLGNKQTIRNTTNFPPGPTLDGYNTTPGGAYFVEIQGNTLTFSFASPIQAFGAYFSGIQTNFFQDTVNFNDGTSQVLNIPGTGTNSFTGALSFVGFTDAGASISSVTINAGNGVTTGADFIGIDDVRFGPVTSVPEPVTLSIFGVGAFGAVSLRRRKKA